MPTTRNTVLVFPEPFGTRFSERGRLQNQTKSDLRASQQRACEWQWRSVQFISHVTASESIRVGSEAVFVRLFGAAASGKQPGGIEELERSRRERERESRLFLQVTTTCGQARC